MTCADHLGHDSELHDPGHHDFEHHDSEHHDSEHHDSEHGEFEHGEFDCSRARLQLYEYLDGEMAPDDCIKIREHLEQCGPCLEEYDLDQMLKALVRRSCGCEVAPTELRMQIIARIATFSMTVEFSEE